MLRPAARPGGVAEPANIGSMSSERGGTSEILIREPLDEDLERLAVLFDAYRVFYEQPSDLDGSTRFVRKQLAEGVTRFFVAALGDAVVGFMHLLPLVHTTVMRPSWLLEDLYVDAPLRGRGVGSALLAYAEDFARRTGAGRISLTTAHTNVTAQRVYEAAGYTLDTTFRTYHRKTG